MQNKRLKIFCLLLPLVLVAIPAMAVDIILSESVNPSITLMDAPLRDAPFDIDRDENKTSAYVVWIALGTVGGSGIVGLMVLFCRGLRRSLRPARPHHYYYRQRRAVIDRNARPQQRIIPRRMARRRSILGWEW